MTDRMPPVAQKVFIGAEELQAAQDGSGLSNEALGHRLHVSERTWRRWKEEGSVPTSYVPAVATHLRLELAQIVESEPETFSLDELQRVRELLEEFQTYFADLSRRLDALRLPPEREPRSKSA